MNEAIQKAFQEGAVAQRKRNAGKEVINTEGVRNIEPDYPYCFGNIHIEEDGEIITSCLGCKFKKECFKNAIKERKHDKVFKERVAKFIEKHKK